MDKLLTAIMVVAIAIVASITFMGLIHIFYNWLEKKKEGRRYKRYLESLPAELQPLLESMREARDTLIGWKGTIPFGSKPHLLFNNYSLPRLYFMIENRIGWNSVELCCNIEPADGKNELELRLRVSDEIGRPVKEELLASCKLYQHIVKSLTAPNKVSDFLDKLEDYYFTER